MEADVSHNLRTLKNFSTTAWTSCSFSRLRQHKHWECPECTPRGEDEYIVQWWNMIFSLLDQNPSLLSDVDLTAMQSRPPITSRSLVSLTGNGGRSSVAVQTSGGTIQSSILFLLFLLFLSISIKLPPPRSFTVGYVFDHTVLPIPPCSGSWYWYFITVLLEIVPSRAIKKMTQASKIRGKISNLQAPSLRIRNGGSTVSSTCTQSHGQQGMVVEWHV